MKGKRLNVGHYDTIVYIIALRKIVQQAEHQLHKDSQVLIHGTYVYVTFHGKRDFAPMSKDLQMERLPRLLGPTNITTGVMIRGRSIKSRERFEDATLEILKMEEKAPHLGIHAASRRWKRQGNKLFPSTSRRNTA